MVDWFLVDVVGFVGIVFSWREDDGDKVEGVDN